MDMKICEHIWAEIEPGIYKNLKNVWRVINDLSYLFKMRALLCR